MTERLFRRTGTTSTSGVITEQLPSYLSFFDATPDGSVDEKLDAPGDGSYIGWTYDPTATPPTWTEPVTSTVSDAELSALIKNVWITQEYEMGPHEDWRYRRYWTYAGTIPVSGGPDTTVVARRGLAICNMPPTNDPRYETEQRSRNTWFWRLALAWAAWHSKLDNWIDLFVTLEGIGTEGWYSAHVVDDWWPLIGGTSPSFFPYTTDTSETSLGETGVLYGHKVPATFAPWKLKADSAR